MLLGSVHALTTIYFVNNGYQRENKSEQPHQQNPNQNSKENSETTTNALVTQTDPKSGQTDNMIQDKEDKEGSKMNEAVAAFGVTSASTSSSRKEGEYYLEAEGLLADNSSTHDLAPVAQTSVSADRYFPEATGYSPHSLNSLALADSPENSLSSFSFPSMTSSAYADLLSLSTSNTPGYLVNSPQQLLSPGYLPQSSQHLLSTGCPDQTSQQPCLLPLPAQGNSPSYGCPQFYAFASQKSLNVKKRLWNKNEQTQPQKKKKKKNNKKPGKHSGRRSGGQGQLYCKKCNTYHSHKLRQCPSFCVPCKRNHTLFGETCPKFSS